MKRCWMVCIFRISGWKLKGLIANCLYCLCKVGDMSSFENGCGGLRKLEMYKMKKLQGYIAQHKEYNQWFIITVNEL